jgi:DNA-binding GntR family transcriptional regulator
MITFDPNVRAERTLADRAYGMLRRDIVAGRLPAGAKLKLETLVQDYGIGMSPMREALARLVGDLLVVAEGQRGFWVPNISVSELDDITRTRSLLECEALALAIQHGDAAWEARVRDAYGNLERVEAELPEAAEPLPLALLADWERWNGAFHSALVSACGSPWLIRLRGLLYQQSERYRWVSLKASRGRRSVQEEHAAIFDAAMGRNLLRANRMTELHLAKTAEEVRRLLEAALSGEDGGRA